jgi:peptide/nickel transport system ATP-binding protein
LLEIKHLNVNYRADNGTVHALTDVSLTLERGRILGLAGESGSGKSTLGYAITRLLKPPAEIVGGEVLYYPRASRQREALTTTSGAQQSDRQPVDVLRLSQGQLRALRWTELAIVFQSAMNALNPVISIGAQFKDALEAHGRFSKRRIAERSAEVLDLVGIDAVHLKSYPHQLSGGMRQRAMIAMALLFTPDLVIMDEPTSALDVVAQRALMIQIRDLQKQLGFAVVFVTHDMSLVSHFSDQLLVMYAGQVVEIGPTRTVFDNPSHPYSRGLLDAFPSIRGRRIRLTGIPGSPPDLGRLPSACRFHDRCPVAQHECSDETPELYPVGQVASRCLLHRPGNPIEPAETSEVNL